MKLNKYIITSIFIIFSLVLIRPAKAQEKQAELFIESARNAVAEFYKISPKDLEIANSSVSFFPLQGKTVFSFKFFDRLKEVYGISLDENGKVVDINQLASKERSIYTERYGAMSPELYERVAIASPDELIEVSIWLTVPPYEGPMLPTPDQNVTKDEIEAKLKEMNNKRTDQVLRAIMPVVERLQRMGYKVLYDTYSPMLIVRLTPGAIHEVARWDEVLSMDLTYIVKPELEIASPTITADVVHSRGITGSGVPVAQIEVGGKFAIHNPYLYGVTQDYTYICSTISEHSTAVAGIIRANYSSVDCSVCHGHSYSSIGLSEVISSSVQGISPNVSLWAGGSCNGVWSELKDRSIAAANWGARVINLSWGVDIGLTPKDMDKFYDEMVINRRLTVIKSAGNEACGGTGNVTSPGLAYNVITVGGFDDLNTTGWSDDIMYSCSSWKDPVSGHNDREKPELVAPGVNINTTLTYSPWIGDPGMDGTSLSAPMVTGIASLLIQRDGFLGVWPETIKAILMVTTVHNIEGFTRLSEYDGTGGVVADRADDVARGYNGGKGGLGYSCSTSTPLEVTQMYLGSGIRTRVAIVWDNDPNYFNYANKPSADLDLSVLDPNGYYVASSSSWDNTYEIVEFIPQMTGYYKLRVNKYRCDMIPPWLGWAWYSGN